MLVSIVTPSFNSARYLEETIQSVLSQDYQPIEYWVIDGGSTDGTLDILNRYAGRLQFVSAPDNGQADAVNRGFARCSGAIFAFLNADDLYLPGAISAAVRAFTTNSDAAVVYGRACHIGAYGERLGRYPVEPFSQTALSRRCFICQPAAFIRSDAFRQAGMLNASMHYSLDYDLWVRLAQLHSFAMVDRELACSRLHADAKTVSNTAQAMRETLNLLKRHYGYVPFNWLYGYCHHRLTGQAIAAEAPRAKWTSAFYSAAVGARYNWRHPLRYLGDIASTAKEGLAWAHR